MQWVLVREGLYKLSVFQNGDCDISDKTSSGRWSNLNEKYLGSIYKCSDGLYHLGMFKNGNCDTSDKTSSERWSNLNEKYLKETSELDYIKIIES